MLENFLGLQGRHLYYKDYMAIIGVLACFGVFIVFFLLSKSYHLAKIPKLCRRCCKKKPNERPPDGQQQSGQQQLELPQQTGQQQPGQPTLIHQQQTGQPQQTEQQQTEPNSVSHQVQINIDPAQSNTQPNQTPNRSQAPKAKKRRYWLIIFWVFRWIAFLGFVFMFIVLSSLDVMPVPVTIVISILVLSLLLLKDIYSTYKSSRKIDRKTTTRWKIFKESLRARKIPLFVALFFILFFSIFVPLALYGSCIAFFNNASTFGSVHTGYTFSTYMIRSLYKDESCPRGPPCHFFAILPENAATSVLLHVHTHSDYDAIAFDVLDVNDGSSLGLVADQYVYQVRNVEKSGQRNIHIALVDGLSPDTTYTMTVTYNGTLQASYKYTTLPVDESSKDLKIVVGGDAGANNNHIKMSNLAATYSPDVIVMGGDLAYDNNIRSCYYTWDGFLTPLENIGHKLGKLVPMIFSVGNHEVGLNDYSGVDVPIDEDGPIYFSWFAQHTINKKIPTLTQRTSYQYHIVGDILLFSLDTGYVANMTGTQLTWINSVASDQSSLRKLAVYHKPMYTPCAKKIFPSRTDMMEGVVAFTKAFDTYDFKLNIENHNHMFKRTKPIRNNQVSDTGTVYIGEGCWAVTPTSCTPTNVSGVMEKMDNSVNNFWLLTISATQITAVNYNLDGGVIDYVVIS